MDWGVFWWTVFNVVVLTGAFGGGIVSFALFLSWLVDEGRSSLKWLYLTLPMVLLCSALILARGAYEEKHSPPRAKVVCEHCVGDTCFVRP